MARWNIRPVIPSFRCYCVDTDVPVALDHWNEFRIVFEGTDVWHETSELMWNEGPASCDGAADTCIDWRYIGMHRHHPTSLISRKVDEVWGQCIGVWMGGYRRIRCLEWMRAYQRVSVINSVQARITVTNLYKLVISDIWELRYISDLLLFGHHIDPFWFGNASIDRLPRTWLQFHVYVSCPCCQDVLPNVRDILPRCILSPGVVFLETADCWLFNIDQTL